MEGDGSEISGNKIFLFVVLRRSNETPSFSHGGSLIVESFGPVQSNPNIDLKNVSQQSGDNHSSSSMTAATVYVNVMVGRQRHYDLGDPGHEFRKFQ